MNPHDTNADVKVKVAVAPKTTILGVEAMTLGLVLLTVVSILVPLLGRVSSGT